jgi:hypothetical protein
MRGRAEASKLKCVVAWLAIAAAFAVSDALAEGGHGQINVEGGWAYTTRSDHGGIEHIATTRAAEDNIWLLLACSADEQLTVSLVHPEQFPFPLKRSSQVELRSNNVPTVSIEGKSLGNNQIVVDPRPMRHIMLPLLQDAQLVVSLSERDGTTHDYTFSLQPNERSARVALVFETVGRSYLPANFART